VDTRGTLYDGTTAYAHPVSVREPSDIWLVITTDSGHAQSVPFDVLTRIEDDGAAVRLGRSDVPGWRLVLQPPIDPRLLAALPGHARYGRWIDRLGLGKAALLFAGVAAAVLAVGYTAPHLLAPHVPEAWERDLGQAIVGDFGDRKCRNPAGQRALEALAERVEPGVTGAGERRISFAALNVNMFNAAAIPGNHIIFFKGAVTETRNAEELAGIMAHEIAHVRRRHVTEALLRELGIGALIRLFAGGIGANAQQIMSLSYTRSNEAEADADAIAALRRAGIDPRQTARLFARLAGDERRGTSIGVEWLESHPASRERARRFAASYNSKLATTPALSQQQSDELFNICWKGAGDRPVRRAPAPR
jgi:beta-barrel assembly-enhancing protease